MWSTSYQATTPAGPEAVWRALTALHSGTPLGPDSDRFELHGPLAVGTELTVTPVGQDPMQSVIIELEPGRVYADQTIFGRLKLIFRHEIIPVEEGRTEVTHTLVISGADADEVGPELGPQVSADFPATMAELLTAAERGLVDEAAP